MMSLQLRELAGYGFQEFWVNGRIEGPSARKLAAQVAELFPAAPCHSCGGVPTPNNIRWVGTGELAFGPMPSYAAVDNVTDYKADGCSGNPRGKIYDPPSCDAVLREHCWFGGDAYPDGHCKLSSTSNLLRKYLTSVGRSCNLILNIAPDTHGAIADDELAAYESMGNATACMFSQPVAKTPSGARLPMDSTGAIEWAMPRKAGGGVVCQNCSLVLMEELAEAGQLIGNYTLHCQNECSAADGGGCRAGAEPWKACTMGSLTIGGAEAPAIGAALVPGVGHKRIVLLRMASPLLGLRMGVGSHYAVGGQVPRLKSMALYDWGGAVEGCV
jgi:hypothetical protein